MTHQEIQALIAIRRKLASSRAELSRLLGVSRPTASTIAASLLAKGLIREMGRGVSSGGKAPTLLAAAPESSYYFGVDLGYADRINAVLIDGTGAIVRQEERPFTADTAREAADKLKIVAGDMANGVSLSGVAAAVSGIVEWNTGRVLQTVFTAYQGDALRMELEREFNLPILVENRARMAAVAEAFGGVAENEPDFALISLGKSIGSAIHINRELYAGRHSTAGEFRHLRLSCGMSMEEAMARDTVASASPEETLKRCAEGLLLYLGIIDLDLLVLSGRFADFGPAFPALLEEELRKHNFVCRVRASRFGRFCAARGAAFRLGELQIIKKST